MVFAFGTQILTLHTSICLNYRIVLLFEKYEIKFSLDKNHNSFDKPTSLTSLLSNHISSSVTHKECNSYNLNKTHISTLYLNTQCGNLKIFLLMYINTQIFREINFGSISKMIRFHLAVDFYVKSAYCSRIFFDFPHCVIKGR